MHRLNKTREKLWKSIDAVLPPRCVVTGEIVDRQGMIDPRIWKNLNFISEPFCACCGYPFEFGAEKGMMCASCLTEKPPYKTARAALAYDDASRDMILKFKHADQTHAVHAFIPWIRRIGAEMLESADCVVPVPLHRFRLLQRRYNQSALIAQVLSRHCGLLYIPDALYRQRATPSQGHLGYKERVRNVRGAFAVSERYKAFLKNKKAVLVDDVYTTGSTVTECAKSLLKAGAAEVHVLAVARVIRPE